MTELDNAMPSASHVRAARAFLRGKFKAGTSDISPRKFAAAAKETGLQYHQLIALIARMYQGGQGEQAQRQENIRSVSGAAG